MDGELLVVAYILAGLLGLVIFIAVIGNAAVCYLVVRVVPFSVTNVFLFNLSLADILLVLFCVPIVVVTDVLRNGWVFGPAMCKVIPYIQGVSVFLSAFTHVVISCDRFVVVNYPMRPRISRRKALCVVLGVWAVALLAAVPMPVVSKYTGGQEKGPAHCGENWYLGEEVTISVNPTQNSTSSPGTYNSSTPRVNRVAELTYTTMVLLLQYVLPVSITTGTYTIIVFRLWGRRPPGESDQRRDQRIARSKRKMVKMVIIVASLYAISQLPRNVVYFIGTVHENLWQSVGIELVWAAVYFLAISATCYNPIIYFIMNEKFRAGFLHIIFAPCSNDSAEIRRRATVAKLTYSARSEWRRVDSRYSRGIETGLAGHSPSHSLTNDVLVEVGHHSLNDDPASKEMLVTSDQYESRERALRRLQSDA